MVRIVYGGFDFVVKMVWVVGIYFVELCVVFGSEVVVLIMGVKVCWGDFCEMMCCVWIGLVVRNGWVMVFISFCCIDIWIVLVMVCFSVVFGWIVGGGVVFLVVCVFVVVLFLLVGVFDEFLELGFFFMRSWGLGRGVVVGVFFSLVGFRVKGDNKGVFLIGFGFLVFGMNFLLNIFLLDMVVGLFSGFVGMLRFLFGMLLVFISWVFVRRFSMFCIFMLLVIWVCVLVMVVFVEID